MSVECPAMSAQLQTIDGSAVAVLFRAGAMEQLGEAAHCLRGSRVLIVSDPGIRKAGHVQRAVVSLAESASAVGVFDRAIQNPTTDTVDAGLSVAQGFDPDLIVGLGGGSSMDTAKGINFLYTNGGRMADYWGTGKATRPMLPMIAIPTTAGTGSEAQSYALISDPLTHAKMACGDRKALPKVAILDPELTATQPLQVAAVTGLDAISHAVETAACRTRTDTSRRLSREAWERLSRAYEPSLADPGAIDARQDMLMGAHLAGCAIEDSMLGAAHATANPLTARFGLTHGIAVGLMLPQVIRYNAASGENPYADLDADPERLARRIEAMLKAARLPATLAAAGVPKSDLPELAALAEVQWTARFNPRDVRQPELLDIYRRAF